MVVKYEDILPAYDVMPGVYVIHFGDHWVYVGESKDIYMRLNSHRCNLRRGTHKYSNDARIDTIPTDEVYIKVIPSNNRQELEVMIQGEYGAEGRLINEQIGRRTSESKKANQMLAQGRPILQYDLNMNFIKEWPSARSTRRAGYKCASSVANFRPGSNTSGGFIWRWKDEVSI